MTEVEQRLLGAIAAEARGPKRNGIFALWLFARVAETALTPAAVSPRHHRKRVELLQRRLSSVSVPPPLRRALTGAIRLLAEGTPHAAALALHHLVAPARETVGPGAADALVLAAQRGRRTAASRERA